MFIHIFLCFERLSNRTTSAHEIIGREDAQRSEGKLKLKEAILVGLSAIFVNKMRSLLTMLGITTGVASVLSMIAIGDGAKQVVLKDLELSD